MRGLSAAYVMETFWESWMNDLQCWSIIWWFWRLYSWLWLQWSWMKGRSVLILPHTALCPQCRINAHTLFIPAGSGHMIPAHTCIASPAERASCRPGRSSESQLEFSTCKKKLNKLIRAQSASWNQHQLFKGENMEAGSWGDDGAAGWS